MTMPENEDKAPYLTAEEIELELMKIPEILKRLDRLEKEHIIMNKRIKKLQEGKNV